MKRVTASVNRNRLSILIYHQVLNQKDPLRPSEPSPLEFDRQMALVGRYLNPIPLVEGVRLLKEGRLPGNAVAVTFDDGYRNNLDLAAPILARHGVPATFFVTTGFFGEAMWNDQVIELVRRCQGGFLDVERLGKGRLSLRSTTECLAAIHVLIGELKYRPWQERRALTLALLADHDCEPVRNLMMTEKEIQQLHGQGFEIAAHTQDHPIMTVEEGAEQERQIRINKECLEGIIDEPVRGFAYPNGRPLTDFDQTSAKLVEALGFEYAVTTQVGVSRPRTDPYQLPRFTPWDKHRGKFYLRLLRNALTG